MSSNTCTSSSLGNRRTQCTMSAAPCELLPSLIPSGSSGEISINYQKAFIDAPRSAHPSLYKILRITPEFLQKPIAVSHKVDENVNLQGGKPSDSDFHARSVFSVTRPMMMGIRRVPVMPPHFLCPRFPKNSQLLNMVPFESFDHGKITALPLFFTDSRTETRKNKESQP